MMFLCFSALSSQAVAYSVVTDCGSSGSRAFLYEYEENEKWPNVTYKYSQNLGYKLSDAEFDDSVVPSIIKKILNFVNSSIGESKLSQTSIYMYATGGMRLLTEQSQQRIIQSTINEIKTKTSMKTKESNVRVITGNEEGIFMWLTVNNILNGFLPTATTVGALDFGGASAQISIETDEASEDQDYHKMNIKDHSFNIFSHSFLGIGINEFDKLTKTTLMTKEKSIIYHPCYFEGYNNTYKNITFIGAPNFTSCDILVKDLLVPIMKATKMPNLKKTREFYGFSGFDAFTIFARIPNHINLSFLRSASQEVCKLPYEEAKKRDEEQYAPTYCLSGILQYHMLKSGYGFDENVDLHMTNRIKGIKASWTMGALIHDLFNSSIPPQSKSNLPLILSIVCVSVLIIIGIVSYLVYRMVHTKSGYDEVSSSNTTAILNA